MDPQRAQHVLDQLDLPPEQLRRRRPVGLVLREALRAERLPGDVEGHGDVRRPLVAQRVDQHRREPVHRVRRLAGRRREVLHRQGVERPVRQRVAIQQQQARAGGLRGGHPLILGWAP